MTGQIDTGDIVRHGPTGEEWVVALVDGSRLSWCGWPEGYADLADCALVRKATPQQRLQLLREMAQVDGLDHRARYARRRLAEGDAPASSAPTEEKRGTL